MRVVYIAAPLNAPTPEGREQNRAEAAKWVAWAARRGFAPIATWIVLSGEWDESPANRALGLEIDKALIERCDELWLCGPVVSAGMRIEADHAKLCGKPVKAYLGFWEPAEQAFVPPHEGVGGVIGGHRWQPVVETDDDERVEPL